MPVIPGIELVGATLDIFTVVTSLYKVLRYELDKAGDRELVLSFVGLQKRRIDEIQDELIRLQAESEVLRTDIKGLRVETETSRVEADGLQSRALGIDNTETTQPTSKAGRLSRNEELLRDRETLLNSLGDKIDMKLETYVKSLRNYDFLTQDPVPDPFEAWGRWFRRKRRTQEAADDSTPDRTKEKYNAGLLEPRGIRELDREGREEREREKKQWQRLTMGMFGGAALIAPLLLMVLLHSSKASLITTSVATFLFAAILAFFGRTLSGQDVLAATAAYTAVLVVFVGASTSST